MKVTINIDCSPQEARAMLGLPDVSPLHDIYLDRMKAMMEQGVTPDMVTDMVRSWSSMGGAGMALMQQMLGQLGSGLAPRTDDEGPAGRRR